MRIAFLGDSITRGIPRVSYFRMLQSSLEEHELFNFGKGGDTVNSLYRRIKRKHLNKFDEFVLFIGVNDVYSKINKSHEIMKTLRRQYWSKNLEEFKDDYTKLIVFLNSFQKKFVVVAPLVFGEELDSKWNKELDEYERIIKDIVRSYENIHYLDVRSIFKQELTNKQVSNYLPYSLFETGKDVAVLDSDEKVDQMSTSRGLYLTLDGCHLNSKGARILANEITKYYKK